MLSDHLMEEMHVHCVRMGLEPMRLQYLFGYFEKRGGCEYKFGLD